MSFQWGSRARPAHRHPALCKFVLACAISGGPRSPQPALLLQWEGNFPGIRLAESPL
jgi:hypothetical protein